MRGIAPRFKAPLTCSAKGASATPSGAASLSRVLLVAALTAGALPVRAQIEAQPGLHDLEEQEKARRAEKHQLRLTKPPRLIYQVPPVYPETARAEHRTGTVITRITIDEEGYVQRADVLQSAGADLDDAAMGAVCNFVFEPAEVDDIPAPIQIDFRQAFTLQEVIREVPAVPPPEAPAPEAELEAAPDAGLPPSETGPVNFHGMVRESGTKHALADAEIAVQLDEGDFQSAMTGKDGRFELRGIPAGARMVRVAATEHESMITTEIFSATEMVEATYFLPRRTYNKYETIIQDTRPTKDVNRIALSRAEVSEVPGTFGDPLRVIENLPGMARAPLLGGQLIVRGASPASTGVYMDGVQIPLLYHFGGLTSVVNAEFLEDIEFYPGGFGARYGRATAGIVDVKSRTLRMNDYRGTAKIDIMESGFFFGGPVTLWGNPVDSDAPNPRRLTIAVAARRSYIDAIIPLALGFFLPGGAGAITIAPVYWDYQAKLEYRPVAAHTFQLFGFGSDDSLKILAGGVADASGLSAGTHQQFHRFMGRWEWRIAPRMTSNTQAFIGLDSNDFGVNAGALQIGSTDYNQVFGLRNDIRYQLLPFLSLNGGIDYTVGLDNLSSDLPNIGIGGGGFGGGGGGGLPSISVEFPRIRQHSDAIQVATSTKVTEQRTQLNLAPWVEAEIGPIAGLKIIPGFRFDYYKYGDNTRRFQPNPRLAVIWEPIKGTKLKAAYGVYEQAPTSQQASPTYGNPSLFPSRARHYILGLEQRLTPRISVSTNLFYNRREELVVASARVLSIDNGVYNLERYNNAGLGNAYGADFMLRHDLGANFFGWIAYTLSRSEVKNKPNAQWRPFQYDQTHILTVVGQYKFPWHLPFREWSRTGRLPRGVWWNSAWTILSGDLSVGGRFRLVTGNPATFYQSVYHDLDRDRWVPTSNAPSSDRMPTFHQLDIRVDYKMAFDNFLVDLYVDMLNVYNHVNAELVQWDYRFRTPTFVGVIPFLPIFGLTAEF